jgi:hypothetical protein
MMNKKVKQWELIGIIPIIIFGTTLHFWFEWTGHWRPMALIAAVNESTWEHFKMGFWPALFYALIEYPFLKQVTKNFWGAKFLGLLTMPVVISILFYGYTAVTGHHYLIADAVIFILSVVAGQLVSLSILTREKTIPAMAHRLSFVGLMLMIAAFSLLSYYPRENFLFEDPVTGEYGILEEYHDH